MPRFPPRPEYQALPWRQIREQYETTDISFRQLAQKWSIRSKTTLERRAKEEGWTRRISTIATHLALLQVAGEAEPHSPNSGAKKINSDTLHREAEPHSPNSGAKKINSDTLHREAEASPCLTARALATMQSQRVLRQVEIAEQIQEAACNILRLLTGVLTDTDDKVGEHIKRLIAICPDGEKLATLVKAAAEAIDRAVVIERRALGMDMVRGVVPDPDNDQFDSYRDTAIRTVRKMDLAMGLKLREYAAQVAEDQRRERQGGK